MTGTICGHETNVSGTVTAYGVSTSMRMPLINNMVEFCLDCIAKMTIQCGWCKSPIFIGSPITLYTPLDPNFKVPSFATIYSREPLRLVGCMDWGCAYSGADCAGGWVPGKNRKGRVKRRATAFEQMFGPTHGGALSLVASSEPALADPIKQIVYPIY